MIRINPQTITLDALQRDAIREAMRREILRLEDNASRARSWLARGYLSEREAEKARARLGQHETTIARLVDMRPLFDD